MDHIANVETLRCPICSAGDMKLKSHWLGFPDASVVENLPASAGDTGSIPDLERSHMNAEQLSLCSTAQEPQLLKPEHPWAFAPQEKPPLWEAHTPQLENGPGLLQLEKRLWQQRPSTAKNETLKKNHLSWNTKFVFNCRELRKHTVDSERTMYFFM